MKLTNSQNNLMLFSLLLLLTGSIIAAYKKFQVPGIAGFKRTDFLAIPEIAGYETGAAQASFRNDPYKISETGRQTEARGFTIDLDDPEGMKTPAVQKPKTVKKQEEHYFNIESEIKPNKKDKSSAAIKEETVLLAEEKEAAPREESFKEEPETFSRVKADKNKSPSETEGSGGRININTAGIEELMKIPFVGKVTANNIIIFRNDTGGYKKIEDIKKVPKMERYFDRIKDFITVK